MRPATHAATNAALLLVLAGTLASMFAAPHFWAQHGQQLASDLLHAAELLDDEVRHVARTLRTRARAALAR